MSTKIYVKYVKNNIDFHTTKLNLPTSALDVTTKAQVIKELKAINNEYGTAMIIVTHNIDALRKLADNVMIMRDGVMLEYGKTSDVLNNPQNEYTRKLIKASPKLDS
jgi:peptide/nickel transport system ATP-binding protein